MKKLFIYNIPAIVWSIFIFYVLTVSGSSLPKYPWLALLHIDKFVHFFLFFILSCLFVIGRKYRNPESGNLLYNILIVIIGSTYGGIMEYMQPVITIDRVRDVYDASFNISGSLIGVLFFVLLKRLKS